MSSNRSKSSQDKNHFKRSSKVKKVVPETQNRVLAPIYDKVALLRKQLEAKNPPPQTFISQEMMRKDVIEHFLELEIDRNADIEQKRKQY